MELIIDAMCISLLGMKVAVYPDSNGIYLSAYEEGDSREGECLFNLTHLDFVPNHIRTLLNSPVTNLKFYKKLVKAIVIGSFAKEQVTILHTIKDARLAEYVEGLHSCVGDEIEVTTLEKACSEYLEEITFRFTDEKALRSLDASSIRYYLLKNDNARIIQDVMRAIAYTDEYKQAQLIKKAKLDVNMLIKCLKN